MNRTFHLSDPVATLLTGAGPPSLPDLPLVPQVQIPQGPMGPFVPPVFKGLDNRGLTTGEVTEGLLGSILNRINEPDLPAPNPNSPVSGLPGNYVYLLAQVKPQGHLIPPFLGVEVGRTFAFRLPPVNPGDYSRIAFTFSSIDVGAGINKGVVVPPLGYTQETAVFSIADPRIRSWLSGLDADTRNAILAPRPAGTVSRDQLILDRDYFLAQLLFPQLQGAPYNFAYPQGSIGPPAPPVVLPLPAPPNQRTIIPVEKANDP